MKSNRKIYQQDFSDFNALKLTIASPEQILQWSYGEVTKAETINYRTLRTEPDGLFCEKIFGPTKNHECFCGKYKKIRYKGIVCDKCGVEVTLKDVRRERMGHIDLAVPVAHVWFAYGVPNKMSSVLDMSHKKMLSVVYYTRYMVTEIDDAERAPKLESLKEFRKEALSNLEEELNEEVAEIVKDYETQKKEAKSSKKKDKSKSEFNESRLDHKSQQAQAKLRRDYAEREEELEEFYGGLEKIISEVTEGYILTEDQYLDLQDRDLMFFEAKMGAQAIEDMLNKLDIGGEITRVKRQIKKEKSATKRANLIKRLQYLEGLDKNDIDPTWMIVKTLPVIPPELRPIIPLSGGKFATSDLNDLYRRIINRNNRLKRLVDIGAPDVILRNEKRMLQESVDALIDNSHRPARPMLNPKKLPYRSLTDELRGKKGIFRRNLLGKRVDYSGRAVIIGDTKLLLHQCGLPKSVALEMFKPFVIRELMDKEHAPNIKVAKEMIEEEIDVVWDILEGIIDGRPVLLNRAPTLHKYSIQAFYPILVEGEAIRVHPLVCKAYNADFDGDQMAVHVLLTDEAVQEGKDKMLSTKNIISIANGSVLASPTKDMLLGYFLMTDYREVKNPKVFADGDAVVRAYVQKELTIDEQIFVTVDGQKYDTSAGRVIFNRHLPDGFEFVNERVGKSVIDRIINEIKKTHDNDTVVSLLDDLKMLGFKYATNLAFSFAIEDCNVDLDLDSRIEEVKKKDIMLNQSYLEGLSTEAEKNAQSTNMWYDFTEELAEEAWASLDKNNSVYEMVNSGANGGQVQARQIMSIKGLIRNTEGNWIPLPITGNYRDGLNAFEYFVSTTGGRKGVADSALRTASSGYLTRKLTDVAHDVIVRAEDCGYEGEGYLFSRDDVRRVSFEDNVHGRTLAQDVQDKDGNVVAKAGETLTREIVDSFEKLGVDKVYTRSPILCTSPLGICQKCYGLDIESNEPVEMGKAVGVIAAQSIGEPGTQLTLRSFHFGGAMKVDITQGLPRVEELLEARTPKAIAEINRVSGKVKVEEAEDGSAVITITGTKKDEKVYIVTEAKKVNVADGDKVKIGDVLYLDYEGNERQSPFDGVVSLDSGILTVHTEMKAEETVNVLPGYDVFVIDGQEIEAGTQLTDGSVDPKKLAEYTSISKAQQYVVNGVQEVFAEQGVSIYDIHVEVIVRQMARMGFVLDSGDSDYLVGSMVNHYLAGIRNDNLRADGKHIAHVEQRLLGIKTSAIKTESMLSAVSFQEQVRVLTEAAISGKVDYLRGMKENVLIGRKIPVGEAARIEDFSALEEVAID